MSERPQVPRGLYLYGVVDARLRITGTLPGVDPQHHVFLLEDGQLAAVVSPVSLEEFGDERLRENLNDVSWLERTARAHESVLEAILGSAAVVPMRLCTIFVSESHVREMLLQEQLTLLSALQRLEGKAEWGAKAFADPAALRQMAMARNDEEAGSAGLSPGAAYLERKRRQTRAREEAEELGDEWAQEIHDRLAGSASEALLNPLQRPEVSGRAGEMLLNGVYLVEDAEAERFREIGLELRRQFGERQVSIELTGPWPAYNFVKSSIESAR